MTISGPKALDNQEAQVSFGAMVTLVSNRIDEWFAKFQETPLKEPSLLGYVIALRGIAQTCPSLAIAGRLNARKAEAWKTAFQKWIDKFGSQVKVSRGVKRDDMWENALREFDTLIDVLNLT